MKRTNIVFSLITAVSVLAPVSVPLVHAGGCFEDPIYDRSGQVKVVIGARVRDVACMEGSAVLKTLPVGKVVQLIGETDGWLKIRDNDGVEGWVGATLLSYTSEPTTSAVAQKPAPVPMPIVTMEPIATPIVTSEPESGDWYDNHPAGSPSDAAPAGLSPANYPGGCYVDPVPKLSLRGKVVIGARVRDGACMVGTIVKKTLPVGRVVELIASTDGWYKIRDADGVEGWVGAQLLVKTDAALSSVTTAPIATPTPTISPITTSSDTRYKALVTVNVRSLGSLRGKILTTVKIGKIVPLLQTGPGWLKIRTENGTVGWVSAALMKKTTSEVSVAPAPAPAPQPSPTPAPSGNTGVITSSSRQQGTIPAGMDLVELNRYWLAKINELRAAKNLRSLVLDQRWVDTASEYAAYMGIHHAMGHERADGKTMHQWIDTKGLAFTTRNSANGWKTNYFTENISWNQIEPTMEAAKRALDDTLKFYLGEAAANGPHYRTIYHADWNSVGAGFYFEDVGNGRVKIYQVFHYGSLVL